MYDNTCMPVCNTKNPKISFLKYNIIKKSENVSSIFITSCKKTPECEGFYHKSLIL